MSGNRAISAAINRRTNNPPPQMKQQQPPKPSFNQPQQQQQQMRQQQQQQQQQPKLSVSDAIALITIRLGRVETFINNLPPLDQLEQYASNSQPEKHENMKIVDDAIFKSIISRLDKIEQTKTTTSTTSPIVAANPIANHEIQSIREENISLKEEINELKNMVLQLQNYTLSTNQKLCDIIFSSDNDEKNISVELSKMLSHHENNNYDENEIESTELNEFLSASLKGMIINEINNTEIVSQETQNLNINI